MSTQTVTTEPTTTLGVSVRPFKLVVGIFAAMGFSLGLAGFLVGYSGHGQISRQALMGLMLTLVPFIGVLTVSFLGAFAVQDVPKLSTSAITLALGGAVGHLLVFAFVFGFVFALPFDPPMEELRVIDIVLRGVAATALAGALIGAISTKFDSP